MCINYVNKTLLFVIFSSVIASNYQTCLGLLLHYPSIEDVHSFIQKSLFLRDPKVIKHFLRFVLIMSVVCRIIPFIKP